MSPPLPFVTVDVFTDRPFFGNPVAVVLDADRLDTDAMQRIARWTNLSETTFVLAAPDAGADYRLRIFTPGGELPFAGHPTLGSARALLDAGRIRPRDGRLVQDCAAGRIALRVDAAGDRLFFEVPASRIGALDAGDRAAIARALGLDGEPPPAFEAIDVGPVWLTAALPDASTVLALRPDMAAIAAITTRLGATGVNVHGPRVAGAGRLEAPQSGWDVAVRSFAPASGVPEDPVCGSGNACVALQRRAAGRSGDYVAAQGEAIGRAGRISVVHRGDAIEVGGAAVVCVQGTIRID